MNISDSGFGCEVGMPHLRARLLLGVRLGAARFAPVLPAATVDSMPLTISIGISPNRVCAIPLPPVFAEVCYGGGEVDCQGSDAHHEAEPLWPARPVQCAIAVGAHDNAKPEHAGTDRADEGHGSPRLPGIARNSCHVDRLPRRSLQRPSSPYSSGCSTLGRGSS